MVSENKTEGSFYRFEKSQNKMLKVLPSTTYVSCGGVGQLSFVEKCLKVWGSEEDREREKVKNL